MVSSLAQSVVEGLVHSNPDLELNTELLEIVPEVEDVTSAGMLTQLIIRNGACSPAEVCRRLVPILRFSKNDRSKDRVVYALITLFEEVQSRYERGHISAFDVERRNFEQAWELIRESTGELKERDRNCLLSYRFSDDRAD
ncbi:MAG TPA: hypothetical protein VEB66_11270 [Opitutaceae bacterium]|nr:hypothetical protein [Opitutaceae bacterium]